MAAWATEVGAHLVEGKAVIECVQDAFQGTVAIQSESYGHQDGGESGNKGTGTHTDCDGYADANYCGRAGVYGYRLGSVLDSLLPSLMAFPVVDVVFYSSDRGFQYSG